MSTDTNETIMMPERFGKIVDAVCAQDRLWFEQNPGWTQYVRDYVPGESYPELEVFGLVIVTEMAPGVRSRCFTYPIGSTAGVST